MKNYVSRKQAEKEIPGQRANWLGDDGFHYLTINDEVYRADRCVHILIKGTDPGENNLRHLNGDNSDDSFANLEVINVSFLKDAK